jgi:hypothetical protein
VEHGFHKLSGQLTIEIYGEVHEIIEQIIMGFIIERFGDLIHEILK